MEDQDTLQEVNPSAQLLLIQATLYTVFAYLCCKGYVIITEDMYIYHHAHSASCKVCPFVSAHICKCTRTPRNKYFELKNSWGCRPNSNYLPASIMIGEGITHVQNTRQLHSMQTHQTYACVSSCVCTCTHPHTAHHTSHTHTQTHTHTHTHTHTVHAQEVYTQDIS